MKYKVVQAVNMKSALMAIHRELGPQAFICRSRSTVSGVEVLAGIESDDEEKMPKESTSEMDLKLSEMANMINQLTTTIATMDKKKEWVRLKSFGQSIMKMIKAIYRKLPKMKRVSPGRKIKYLHNTINQKILSLYRRHPALVPERGVYALIGTSGSGKTTTIIKLASKFLREYSADQISIISCDIDDLYTRNELYQFCKVYQLDYAHVTTPSELKATLQRNRHKRLVLLDTHGVNCRDHLAMKQLSDFLAVSRFRMNTYMVIDSSLKEDIIEEQVSKLSRKDSAGCIVTKLDTAVNPTQTIDHLTRAKYKIAYISTGEDLESDIHGMHEWEQQDVLTGKLA